MYAGKVVIQAKFFCFLWQQSLPVSVSSILHPVEQMAKVAFFPLAEILNDDVSALNC